MDPSTTLQVKMELEVARHALSRALAVALPGKTKGLIPALRRLLTILDSLLDDIR